MNIQDDIFVSDLLNAGLPVRAFIGESLRKGELLLWTPGIYTGFPILAQGEHGPLYPFNWLLFGLLPPYVAVAYAQLLPLFIAGLGCFLLAREWSLPLVPSAFAAGIFCLSGFFVSHLRHLGMNDSAGWIPFIFLTERLLRRSAPHAAVALLV